MHAHIDDDIKNDECKIMFTHELQKGMEKLGEDMKKRFKKDGEQFLKDLQEDIEQFEDGIKDSLENLNRINIDSGFDINIDTDMGINGLGLLGSIASLGFGIFNFWNPVGWASIGLGAIGIAKSVWSWSSSDYKKSQQRKEVDKNLDKVCGMIEERVRNQIEDAKKGICEKVESLKARLNDLVVCYERMREGLIIAGEGLWQIDNNIKTRIAQ
ncbi:hypothetical protein JP0155_08680 [Helicobacter pylori]